MHPLLLMGGIFLCIIYFLQSEAKIVNSLHIVTEPPQTYIEYPFSYGIEKIMTSRNLETQFSQTVWVVCGVGSFVYSLSTEFTEP